MTDEKPRFRFSKRLRLTHKREFQATFNARVRKRVGPLLVYGRPNELGHPRLGLSVSRRVGNAVRRNRIKRLLREAFRLHQHQFAGIGCGYDLVVAAQPHEPLTLEAYAAALEQAAYSIHQQWRQKNDQSRNRARRGPPSPPPPAD